MSDGLQVVANWVRVAGGAACLAWAVVRDCVLAAGAVVKFCICGRRRRCLVADVVADGSVGTLGIGLGDSCCIIIAIDLVTRNSVVSGSMLRSTLGDG